MTKLKIIVRCEGCGKVWVFENEGDAKTYGWEFIEDKYNIHYCLCQKCSRDEYIKELRRKH